MVIRGRHIFYGQSDAPWLAMADFFASVLKNEHCQKLEGLIEAVASCGFICIKPDKVIYCDRPEIAKFDDRGRLHCEDGPALKYHDEWQFYYLSGLPVSYRYVETPADEMKIDEVLKESNAAVRMALINKVGFKRLLATVQNRVVSQADGNSLIEFTFPGRKYISPEQPSVATQKFRTLHVKWQDKTGAKETMLPVPRLARQFGEDCPENVNDCEQVRRWTLGWPKEALAVAET